MADTKLREIERRIAAGDKDSEQALLAEQKRTGKIPEGYWSHIVEIEGNKHRPTKLYRARPWGSDRRTDSWGNSPACGCSDLMRVNTFCVCIGRAWCPTHGGPRCVGGHD